MTNKTLTLGSLFDGSGGFPLGGLLASITPVWASEIEPFPIRVTTKRLPFMKHYGDISQMDGGKIEPVDIITFGSPCTDMSIAGRRAGLDGRQSSLFYEAIRIIKEMRCATDGKYPRWICWENVPGSYSSNKGKDFQSVLEAVIGIAEPNAQVPMPEKARWPYADLYMGDGWSVAYRTLDAQYWGVPQRRRRIYLVADIAGESAGKILFESEGLSGYSAAGFRSWQRTARRLESGAGAAGICLNDQGGDRMEVSEDVAATLRAETHGHLPCIVDEAIPLEHHPIDSRITMTDNGKVQTLTSRMGTGGNNVPLVMKIRSGCEGGGKGALVQTDKSATLSCNNDQTVFVPFGISSYQSHAMLSDNPHSGIYEAETARTLDRGGGNPSCNQGGIAVVAFTQNQRDEVRDLGDHSAVVCASAGTKQQTFVLQGSMIGRSEKNGPQGSGVNEDVCFTLDTADRHAVYAMTTSSFIQVEKNQSPVIMARDYKDPNVVCPAGEYAVRRLTPTECARLQGFPDQWCADLAAEAPSEDELAFWREVWDTYSRVTGGGRRTDKQILKWLRDPYTDSAEYKMWGNGVALPCVWFVLCGIVWYAQSCGE
nr:MAG TPA: Cytosine specific methyltransferase [Caudoviricetes sp.]